jgi:hypothetical protein
MSVGLVTHRARLWFDDHRARGPYRRESTYSSNEGHVGNSGQNRTNAPEAKASVRA